MRSVSIALTFGLLLGAPAVSAQSRETARDEEPTAKPSFERPVVETDVYPAECAEREESDVEAAKGLHRAAKIYFARERYAEAVDAWTTSHRFDCTAHRLLLNIASAYVRLGDVVGAQKALAQYLARAPEPYEEGALEKYQALLATPVPRRLAEPTPDPTEREVPSPEVPLAAWITLGVGSAATVAGVALFAVGAVQTEQSCPEDPPSCTRVERMDAERGVTFQHAGGVMMALGISSMAAAGLLSWIVLEEPASSPELSLHLGPTGVVLDGHF